jgi:hypothetical protein
VQLPPTRLHSQGSFLRLLKRPGEEATLWSCSLLRTSHGADPESGSGMDHRVDYVPENTRGSLRCVQMRLLANRDLPAEQKALRWERRVPDGPFSFRVSVDPDLRSFGLGAKSGLGSPKHEHRIPDLLSWYGKLSLRLLPGRRNRSSTPGATHDWMQVEPNKTGSTVLEGIDVCTS